MLQILPYIYAIIMIFGGGYVALIGFKIIYPKKDERDTREKMLSWHKKFGDFAKYGGIGLLIWGILNLIYPDLNPLNFENQPESKNWTQAQKDKMIIEIINSSNVLKSINHDTAYLITKCYVVKYTQKFTLDEAWEHDKMKVEEIQKITMPLMDECAEKYGLMKKNKKTAAGNTQ